MNTLEPELAEHPFCVGLAPEHLSLMTGCASNVRFAPGEFLTRDGQPAGLFYLLRHGKVGVEVHTPDRGPLMIQTLGPGEVVGWSWLMPPYRWHFDTRALELTRALALDGDCLRRKCENDPRLGHELYRRIAEMLVQRLVAVRLQLIDFYSNNC